ncbi:MAG: iron ABC transporter permease [Salinisphaeraceae bacterium]
MKTPLSYWLSLPVAAAVLAPLAVLAWLGLQAELAFDAGNAAIVINSVLLTMLTVLGAILLGVPLALATTYIRLPGRPLWLALLAAPLAIPSYLGAFAYFAAFGPGGTLENLTGVNTPNLRGLAGATLVMTLYTYPFVLLTTRSALRHLNPAMLDAARTLGLSPGRALLSVVLPRARNGIAAGALLVALYTLSDFGTPAILRLDTFTRMIFVEYNAFGLDRAALLSLQLLALVAVILWLETRFGAERERPTRTATLDLGAGWRAATMTAGLLLMLAALALPLLVFGDYFWREGVGDFDPILAWHSAYAAGLAAIVAVVVALPVAYAAGLGRRGRLLERIAHLGFGVPGIVLATALVYVGLQLSVLYQTLALLVIGYVLRFLPLAVGSLRTRLERIEHHQIAAARSLGAAPFEAFRRITLPLALPGIVAGAALVFLEAMRELPATLLLQPTGFETLATYLWRVYEAGYLGRGAVPALLLVLISVGALVALLTGEERAGEARGA